MKLKEFIKAVVDDEVLVECEFDIGIEPDLTINPRSLNRIKFKIKNES